MTPLKMIAVALLVTAPAVHAADPFYVGTWKIVSAAPAPWFKGTPDLSESKTLTGKIVNIEAKRITGPRQVACPNPPMKLRTIRRTCSFKACSAR